MEPLELIDSAAPGTLLIVGSLPPAGRDYDLMVQAADRAELERMMAAWGFERVRDVWMRFRAGRPEVVEIVTPADWGLPDDETDRLFADALAFGGYRHLRVPAPADQLLILARKLPRVPGRLEDKHRQRALVAPPEAWTQARLRAASWNLEGRLRRLESRCSRPARTRWPPAWLRRPRRGAVVALSGLDGTGKSTQAQALRAALGSLGYDATVVWAPVGGNASLERLARSVKQLLARTPVGTRAGAGPDGAERRWLSRVDDEDAYEKAGGSLDGGFLYALAVFAWSTVMTVTSALTYRRAALGAGINGRVVVYDRYVLDSIVELRFLYATKRRFPLQAALARLIAPTPRCAFLLHASVEQVHARKPDWSLAQTRLRARLYEGELHRLKVRRVDAARPPADISQEITRKVLEAICA